MRTTSGDGAGRMALATLATLAALGLPSTTPATAQSAATRTPNEPGGRVDRGPWGDLDFCSPPLVPGMTGRVVVR